MFTAVNYNIQAKVYVQWTKSVFRSYTDIIKNTEIAVELKKRQKISHKPHLQH